MKIKLFILMMVILMLVAKICSGFPWPFPKAFKGYHANSYYGGVQGYYGGPHSEYGYYGGDRRGSNRRTGRTFADIARVINPQPYAFVGSRPFPGQPFSPLG